MSTNATSSEGPGTRAPGTRVVLDRLYDAFLRGDGAGMLALFDERVWVRFLGQADLHGVDEVRRFFDFVGGLLHDVQFHVRHSVVDGEWAAVLWEETATTASGDPWANHGVDVIRVERGRITVLHENNDTRLVARYFPAYR
jgi:ketosteroid isomerase-like protein